jgi:hypothetical protein
MKRIEKQIESERSELQKILSADEETGARTNKLKELALRVGASTTKLYPGHGDASVPELVHNIHQALQTKSVIAALQTSRTYLSVSIILALIAFFSMVAAWVGAIKDTAAHTNPG